MPSDRESDSPAAGPEPRPRFAWLPRRFLSWTGLAAIVILLVGTSVRFSIASRHVDSPMIDENEVVEQAVAFMGGDLRFFFLKYGPFTMYVLAGIYHVAALLHGTTALDYASQVFFEGSEHYLIARFYMVSWLAILSLAAFASFRRHYGPAPALLVLSLLAFPVLEELAQGARIDLPQAAFQGLALLALGEVVSGGRLRYWLLAGLCAGFAIATKPLPGFLLGPCFIAASWFAARLRPDGTRRGWAARLGATIGSRGLWLAALAVVACAALGNPSMIDLQRFITSQREAVALHSGDTLHARVDLWVIWQGLGWGFVGALGASALLVLATRDPRAILPALFIAVYLAAVYGRAARTYFMVAPAAAGCLLIGHGWVAARELLARWRRRREQRAPGGLAMTWVDSPWARWGWAPVAALIAYGPSSTSWRRAARPNLGVEARQWIHDNIPSMTRIFFVGWRPAGPQLVASNEKIEARWGDHFDYGRTNYAFLKQAFHLGFERYMQSDRPRYALTVHDDLPHTRASRKTPRRITDSLLREAQQKKLSYIILTGYREKSYRDLGYPWFDGATLEREIGKTAIFRVPPPTPEPQTSTAAAQQASPLAPP
jgi:hypothetical protein